MSSVVIDGISYETIVIGGQEYMVENLRRTEYNDGSSISVVEDETEWSELSTGAMCWPRNTTDPDYRNKYGALYNWFATDRLAPQDGGWRVPTRDDFNTLIDYLISAGYNYDGSLTEDKTAKSLAAKDEWYDSDSVGVPGNNQGLNNSTGFTALPAGGRTSTGGWAPNESYPNTLYAYFLTATEETDGYTNAAYFVQIMFNADYVDIRTLNDSKRVGLSIRLVRDYTAETPFNYTSRGKRTLTYKYPDYITNYSKSQNIRQDVLRREFFRRNYDPKKRTFWP